MRTSYIDSTEAGTGHGYPRAYRTIVVSAVLAWNLDISRSGWLDGALTIGAVVLFVVMHFPLIVLEAYWPASVRSAHAIARRVRA